MSDEPITLNRATAAMNQAAETIQRQRREIGQLRAKLNREQDKCRSAFRRIADLERRMAMERIE